MLGNRSKPGSPSHGGPRRMSNQKNTPTSRTPTATMRSVTPGTASIIDSHDDVMALKQRILLLERDLERRQESYIQRERAYKTRIEELDEELSRVRAQKSNWMKTDLKMNKLKSMQGAIVSNVELVQDRTAKILQEQERDLLRAFRARLFDVQTELEKEKSKKDDGAGAWIERSRQLEAEVEWAKEVSDRLERLNQHLTAENSRLKNQFKSQEEDRNFLIKQLVAVKKENSKLRHEYKAIETENAELLEQLQQAVEAAKTTSLPRIPMTKNNTENDERYKEANIRLRKLLADERRSLQQTRNNYTQELRTRTEMEMLLRQCVEDVRKEIARRQIESAYASPKSTFAGKNPQFLPVESFSAEDRERTLELLLSQERVITLLYAKTFPVATKKGLVDDPTDDPERPSTTSQLQPDFLKVLEATAATSRPHTSHGEGQE